MKRLKLIATGGTIAYKFDEAVGASVPAVTGADLIEAVPQLADLAEIDVLQLSNVGSPVLTPEDFLRYARECARVAGSGEADGIVLTMGTATLAECAYMLHLLLDQEIPVVVTGAMRVHSHPSPDGPGNLLDSGIAAISAQTRGWGVLVCANGELHDPREAVKSNSIDLAAFSSPGFGPVGFVRNGRAEMFRRPTIKEHIPVDEIRARVSIVQAVEGDDGKLVDAASEFSDGIVLVGFAPGCVPPTMMPAIERAASKGRCMVLVTRSYGGSLGVGVYERSDGGIEHLMELGVLLGGSLRAAKAQIKLMLALSATRDPNRLQELFPNI